MATMLIAAQLDNVILPWVANTGRGVAQACSEPLGGLSTTSVTPWGLQRRREEILLLPGAYQASTVQLSGPGAKQVQSQSDGTEQNIGRLVPSHRSPGKAGSDAQ